MVLATGRRGELDGNHIVSRAETVLPPPEKYLLDVCDPADYSTSASPQQAFIRRGGALGNGTAAIAGPVWGTATTFAVMPAPRFLNMSWARGLSAAATVNARNDSRWQIPLGADLTGVPASGYWPLRYRVETIVYRTGPLIAGAPFAFLCSYTGGAMRLLEDPGTTHSGYELVSISTLNGGRWTSRWRLAAAGAIVTGADSGVDPAGVQTHIELRYDHTTNPRLSFLINGVEDPGSVLVGAANIPSGNNGNLQVTGVVQGLTVGGGVGQIDLQRQTRFRIEQLTGFPE